MFDLDEETEEPAVVSAESFALGYACGAFATLICVVIAMWTA